MVKNRKTPQEKKRHSLKRDRRNVYGENNKSSRKNIPRSKARARRKARRKTAEIERLWQHLETSNTDALELTLVTSRTQKPSFRKWPDAPLGELLMRRSERRDRSNELGRAG